MDNLFLFLSLPEENYLKVLCPQQLQKDEDSQAYVEEIKNFLVNKNLIPKMRDGSIHSEKLMNKIQKGVSTHQIEKKITQRFHPSDQEYEKELKEAKKIFYEKANLIQNHIKEVYKNYLLSLVNKNN